MRETLWGRALPISGASFSAGPCQLRVPTHVTRPLFRPVLPRTKAGCLCRPQRLPTQTGQCPLCGHEMMNEVWLPLLASQIPKGPALLALPRLSCAPPSMASPHPAVGPTALYPQAFPGDHSVSVFSVPCHFLWPLGWGEPEPRPQLWGPLPPAWALGVPHRRLRPPSRCSRPCPAARARQGPAGWHSASALSPKLQASPPCSPAARALVVKLPNNAQSRGPCLPSSLGPPTCPLPTSAGGFFCSVMLQAMALGL